MLVHAAESQPAGPCLRRRQAENLSQTGNAKQENEMERRMYGSFETGFRTGLRAASFAAAAAAGVTMVLAGAPLDAYANTNTNFTYRRQVIGLSGIMTITGDMNEKVTRAQFARMLVRASGYRSILTTTSNVSVFADVTSGSEYAAAIRICAENGWMTGYLGGNFRPDQYVTLNEAAKGVLYLLGYTADDFGGDQYNRRMAQYSFLDLNENIGYTDPTTVLKKSDCINLFYNLMKCKKKDSNTYYATVLDAEMTSDDEVNALKMADNTLHGPRVAEDRQKVDAIIPFDLVDASCFLNGKSVDKEYIYTAAGDYVVLYWSSTTHTVWAYSADESSDADKRVARGYVQSIYYNSTDTLQPSAVELDDGNTYSLGSTEMQFSFSIYGDLQVGDQVVLIYSVARNSEGEESSYSVIDYVEP